MKIPRGTPLACYPPVGKNQPSTKTSASTDGSMEQTENPYAGQTVEIISFLKTVQVIEKVLTGQCRRCPMLLEISPVTCIFSGNADGRTLFFPVSFVFVDHGSSLVIGHEGNSRVELQVASSVFDHTPTPRNPLLLFTLFPKSLWTS